MAVLGMIAGLAIMWALGSWFLRASAWGALLLAVFWAYILPTTNPGDQRTTVATIMVLCAIEAVLLWFLGHYRFAQDHGRWKSRIAYQLWPFRGVHARRGSRARA